MDTLIASGSSSAESTAQTVASGETVTVVITGVGHCIIDVQGVNSAWVRHGTMSTKPRGRQAFQIFGPVVYRVRRPLQAGTCAIGVEKG